MLKKLIFGQTAITGIYILLNFSRIVGAFKSDIWSKEIDLVNHVTNYSIHLQVISILLTIISIIGLISLKKEIKISKWLAIVILTISLVLLINTQIDFAKWIEINVFGSGALTLFILIQTIIFIWQLTKRKKAN